MISGRIPFDITPGNLGATILTCINEPPRPLRQILPLLPPAVDAIVMRALAHDVGERPAVEELAAGFVAAVAGAPSDVRAARGPAFMAATVDRS